MPNRRVTTRHFPFAPLSSLGTNLGKGLPSLSSKRWRPRGLAGASGAVRLEVVGESMEINSGRGWLCSPTSWVHQNILFCLNSRNSKPVQQSSKNTQALGAKLYTVCHVVPDDVPREVRPAVLSSLIRYQGPTIKWQCAKCEAG